MSGEPCCHFVPIQKTVSTELLSSAKAHVSNLNNINLIRSFQIQVPNAKSWTGEQLCSPVSIIFEIFL